MKNYRHPFNIKVGLFVIGLFIISGLFWLNYYMVNKIRMDARRQVESLADAYSNAINHSEGNDIQYVLEIILPSINFPLIITTNDEINSYKNIEFGESIGTEEKDSELKLLYRKMDRSFDPLPVMWNDEKIGEIKIGEIHYSDPEVVRQLKWLPYLEICGVMIFLFFGFLGFQMIRNSEKNSIWIGMARETAHQLGTPISSLLGWVKLLEDDDSDHETVVQMMNQDLHRLSDISDRFHKIGSTPQFTEIDIFSLSEEICNYMKTRLPTVSDIEMKVSGKHSIIQGERVLLSWSIENLVKNALDAIGKGKGSIEINIGSDHREVFVQIKDTGRGISRKNRTNIFRPGFSTKKRGWGLGLSLTKRIIEDIHHGKIILLHSHPEETVFKIILYS